MADFCAQVRAVGPRRTPETGCNLLAQASELLSLINDLMRKRSSLALYIALLLCVCTVACCEYTLDDAGLRLAGCCSVKKGINLQHACTVIVATGATQNSILTSPMRSHVGTCSQSKPQMLHGHLQLHLRIFFSNTL